MLLRRPPQRTRTAKESGQNETKKQSTATTTTRNDNFSVRSETVPPWRADWDADAEAEAAAEAEAEADAAAAADDAA